VFVVLASDVFFFVFAYLAGSLAEELRAANEKLARARDEVAEYNLQLEARVQERTRVLEKQNRDIQEFIHIITHDLRNIVIASGEIARRLISAEEGRLSQKGRRYAGHLLEDARTMAKMLTGLLALFRVDNSQSQPELVDVGELFGEVSRVYQSTIEHAGATVHIEAMPQVMVDKEELRHVLTNLLDNALKYRLPHVSPIVLFRHCLKESADHFELTDNGMGIDSGQFDRIFDLYHRAPRSAQESDDRGLGIGLAMVKKIVEKWGGKVSVESELGKGATFRFTVPRQSMADIEDRDGVLGV
jgi:signal transduction histidine kinase